ncbi:MAG: glycosyltransferase [Patescibacteria group bacterium]
MTLCYFGIYDPEFGRNKVYITGLKKNGVEVIECRDNARGLKKYWNLWKKHKAISNSYDVLVVGYPGHVVAPWARFLSSKKVVLDALGTLYDAETLSHEAGAIKSHKARFVDWAAVKSAHLVLVESEAQKDYFLKRFGGPVEKYQVLYTGADDGVVNTIESVDKNETFTVLFRGSLTPESGIEYILNAAEIVGRQFVEEKINFLIMGRGIYEERAKEIITEKHLSNVELITERLPWPELVRRMRGCHISLGQFGDNPRLERTIPHKAFESLALGLPYITARAQAVLEILTDRQTCIFVTRADAKDLAEKILELKHDQALGETMSMSEQGLFRNRFTPQILAKRFISLLEQ